MVKSHHQIFVEGGGLCFVNQIISRQKLPVARGDGRWELRWRWEVGVTVPDGCFPSNKTASVRWIPAGPERSLCDVFL